MCFAPTMITDTAGILWLGCDGVEVLTTGVGSTLSEELFDVWCSVIG